MERRIQRIAWGKGSISLFLLALSFFCGVILGQVVASGAPDATGEELYRYLSAYLHTGAQAPSWGMAASTAVRYFRYPLLALLLGFTSVGAVLLLGTAGVFGFFLSFSVSCFAAAFGRNGVLLALALLGPRCLVTVPCFFLMAALAMESSAALFRLSFGKGRRLASVTYGRRWWGCAGVCAAALLAGTFLDTALTPRLLRWLLARILT
ncbi:MAG: stage II sporulation protein M [Oscillibacter sp.]|nr:stage II sporulation protein M [Oscillibacter sp.]